MVREIEESLDAIHWHIHRWWASRRWFIKRQGRRFVYLRLVPKQGQPQVVWELGKFPRFFIY